MVSWIMRWVVSGIALGIVTKLGIGVSVSDFGSLVLATIVIGFVNSQIKPVVSLLTLPITCLTFGIFGLIVNAALFASTTVLVKGFHVDTIWGAMIGPALMSIFSSILGMMVPEEKKNS